MCDYSLFELHNRLAVEGEELVTHRFHTGTIGMIGASSTSPALAPETWLSRLRRVLGEKAPDTFTTKGQTLDRECAVCLPPGAMLRLTNASSSMLSMLNGPTVRFTQRSVDLNRHRDCLEVVDGPNKGFSLSLQACFPGMRVLVLSLTSSEDRVPEAAKAERTAETVVR
jgi:hypothetical protein